MTAELLEGATNGAEQIGLGSGEDRFIIGAILEDVQRICYRGSARAGFHDDDPEEGTELSQLKFDSRLLLIVSEVVEAQDERRAGRPVDKTYYRLSGGAETTEQIYDKNGLPTLKPEGVPSELADVVIRAFDTAATHGINLGQMIIEKLLYNSTRPYRHGKKF